METLRQWTRESKWLVARLLLLLALVACRTAVEEEAAPAVPESATSRPTARAEPYPIATATATPGLPEIMPVVPSPTPGPRMISVRQHRYKQGELVEFTITNPLSRTLYYTYGCGWQRPIYLSGVDHYRLQVSILEGSPVVSELMPGESDRCTWDQQAYQDLDQVIPRRLQSNFELTQVPPGYYRFQLRYTFSEEEAWNKPSLSDSSKAFTAYSQVFTIE